MRAVGDANKYMSDEAPWKLRESDPERMRTIMHVVLQLVDDPNTMMTPFLPPRRRCTGCWAVRAPGPGCPDRRVDEDGGPSYPVITGDYDAAPLGVPADHAGTPLAAPEPLFTKLDPPIVDEELGRLEQP